MRWTTCGVALALTSVVFQTSNTAVLHVDRNHPEDSATNLAADQRRVYTVRQVETASLQPFCLAVLADVGTGAPTRLWPPNNPRACFSEGYAVHTVDAAAPVSGGPGRSVSAVVSIPYADDNNPNTVLVRLTVETGPVPTPDGGRAP